MTDRSALDAVSPLDGRYARYTEPLVPYASEAALMRARIEVEVEYLCALADLEAVPLTLDDGTRDVLRNRYREFSGTDAEAIKRLETEGWARLFTSSLVRPKWIHGWMASAVCSRRKYSTAFTS